MTRFIKFFTVGGSGLLFDVAVFGLLLQTALDTNIARALAFWAAVIFTWFGNRFITFNARDRRVWSQLFRYFLAAHIAGCANLITFYLIGNPIYAAFIAGVVVGTFINFVLASRFVFNHTHH